MDDETNNEFNSKNSDISFSMDTSINDEETMSQTSSTSIQNDVDGTNPKVVQDEHHNTEGGESYDFHEQMKTEMNEFSNQDSNEMEHQVDGENVMGEKEDEEEDTTNDSSTARTRNGEKEQSKSIDLKTFKKKSKELILSVENLQSRIDDVIAFPTVSNFKRLHHQGSATHCSFVELSRLVEFGNTTMCLSGENNSDLPSSIFTEPITLHVDEQMKSKLSSLGTNMWLNVQNNPQVFRDYVSTSSGKSQNRIAQDEKKSDIVLLEQERAAASGYIRSLACRLILISKIRTKDLMVPKLVMKDGGAETKTSNTKDVAALPLARNGELEFAFKCLSRAGRAMLNYSSSVTTMPSIPDRFDSSVAYTTLSLALEFWSSLDQIQKMNNDSSKKSMFIDEVFDVMLLLPDCLLSLKGSDGSKADKASDSNLDVATRTLGQLQRLEDFVNEQISCTGNIPNHDLRIIQQFLPSIARLSYKHGNRLARLSDHVSSEEAIRISLSSTDKCLAMIKDKIENNEDENIERSCQIQEQEMLVLSKQSFYVLSHVYKSLGKIDEAKKCLDRIEIYVDEQIRKDDKHYQEIMKRFTESDDKENEPISNLSGFALEGPKKQDIAEIKARATSARKKARYAEKIERLNLAYCRIMLGHQASYVSDEEERKTDSQFKSMVKLVKDLDSINPRDIETFEKSFLFPSKSGDIFDLVYATARSVCIRRAKNAGIDRQATNPYDSLFALYGKRHDNHVKILLEFLNTILVLANDLHGFDGQNLNTERAEKIDSRAIDVGREILSYIRELLSKKGKDLHSTNSDSTLFSNTEARSDSKIIRTITDTREYFTRALSIYYSSGKCYLLAVKWCDLLVEILQISQQQNQLYQVKEIAPESFKRVLSEIMATKALSLSMTNCHGAALKAAREAYEKCSVEVGNIVTLFHCSVQYEVHSVQDSEQSETFENTLLELDNSLSTFLVTANITQSSEEDNINKILDAFPIMFNTVIKVEIEEFGPLMLGLQTRYTNILVTYLNSSISRGVINLHDDPLPKDEIPGNNNVFTVLCSYLTNFDKVLSSSGRCQSVEWLFEQFQVLQTTLDNVLRLLVDIRDKCNKNRDSLAQFSVSFTESSEEKENEILLFQKRSILLYVGSNVDCLWIAEQLWNIATRVLTIDYETSKQRRNAAELYGKAHDFALLSEEEYGMTLTKEYLDIENFDSQHFRTKMIDFSSPLSVTSIDICSEFSAQCLLLKTAYVIEDLNDKQCNECYGGEISKDEESFISKAMYCLIAASIEMKVLDVDMDEKIAEQVPWLALSLLIALRDDDLCSSTLSKFGLKKRLERSLVDCREKVQQEQTTNLLDKVFHFASRSEFYGMNESTKILLRLYADESIKGGHMNDTSSNSYNSIGLIQRKIINFASKVEEVVEVFNDVYGHVKRTLGGIQCESSTEISAYKTEDIDYFVVEAHNRAVRLLYIGDFINAEKLLTIALNLVPYSGKEVECHAPDIRKVYRGVIQRCSDSAIGMPSFSSSSDNLLDLFK